MARETPVVPGHSGEAVEGTPEVQAVRVRLTHSSAVTGQGGTRCLTTCFSGEQGPGCCCGPEACSVRAWRPYGAPVVAQGLAHRSEVWGQQDPAWQLAIHVGLSAVPPRSVHTGDLLCWGL